MGTKRKVKIEHAPVVARFARRLREVRAERGMTQADLARRAGVTPTYLSKLEAGGAAPGIDLADKLASALGVGLADLVPAADPADPADPAAAARDQARELFDGLVGAADPQTFALLNPLLALLAEAAGKRR